MHIFFSTVMKTKNEKIKYINIASNADELCMYKTTPNETSNLKVWGSNIDKNANNLFYEFEFLTKI